MARVTDFTVLSIVDNNNHLCFFDRFNRIDWSWQKARIIESVRAYNAKLCVDSTGIGDPIFEDLRRAGLNVESFKFTSDSKNDLIQSLAIAFEQGKISIPPIKELVNELMIFEYEMGKTGNIRYSAPEGYHDNAVISLALANWSKGTVERSSGIIDWMRAGCPSSSAGQGAYSFRKVYEDARRRLQESKEKKVVLRAPADWNKNVNIGCSNGEQVTVDAAGQVSVSQEVMKELRNLGFEVIQ